MTGDARLRDGVRRAVAYTRRRPGRLRRRLALSARRSRRHQPTRLAIDGPEERRTGRHPQRRTDPAGNHPLPAERGLAADYGGLASYRPGEQVTRTMTAEALVCWQFLGMPREDPAGNEAGEFLLGQLPGQGAATSTTGTTARWPCTSCRASIGGGGTRPCRPSCSARQRKSRRLGRQLGPRRHLGRLRRPDLQHLAVGPLPGGLLPLPAALFAGGEEVKYEGLDIPRPPAAAGGNGGGEAAGNRTVRVPAGAPPAWACSATFGCPPPPPSSGGGL